MALGETTRPTPEIPRDDNVQPPIEKPQLTVLAGENKSMTWENKLLDIIHNEKPKVSERLVTDIADAISNFMSGDKTNLLGPETSSYVEAIANTITSRTQKNERIVINQDVEKFIRALKEILIKQQIQQKKEEHKKLPQNLTDGLQKTASPNTDKLIKKSKISFASTEEEFFKSPPTDLDSNAIEGSFITTVFDKASDTAFRGKTPKLKDGDDGGIFRGGKGKKTAWWKKLGIALGITAAGAGAISQLEEPTQPGQISNKTTEYKATSAQAQAEKDARDKAYAQAGITVSQDSDIKNAEVVEPESVMTPDSVSNSDSALVPDSQKPTDDDTSTPDDSESEDTIENDLNKPPITVQEVETNKVEAVDTYTIRAGDGLWHALKNTFSSTDTEHGIAQSAINKYYTDLNKRLKLQAGDEIYFQNDGSLVIKRNGKIINPALEAVQSTIEPSVEMPVADATVTAPETTTKPEADPLEVARQLVSMKQNGEIDTKQESNVLIITIGKQEPLVIANEQIPGIVQILINREIQKVSSESERSKDHTPTKFLLQSAERLLQKISTKPIPVQFVKDVIISLSIRKSELRKDLLTTFGDSNTTTIDNIINSSDLGLLLQNMIDSFTKNHGTFLDTKTNIPMYLPDEFEGSITPTPDNPKGKFELEPVQAKVLDIVHSILNLNGLTEKFAEKMTALQVDQPVTTVAIGLAEALFDELNRQARRIKKAEEIAEKGWPKEDNIADSKDKELFSVLKQSWNDVTEIVKNA